MSSRSDLSAPNHERTSEASQPGRAAPSPVVSPRRVLWPTALSILVLVVVTYFTFDMGQFKEVLRELNPLYLGLAVLLVVVRVIIGGIRLQYVSKGVLGFAAGIRGQLAWDFFSNITPSAIGGGPVAGLYVSRDLRIPVGEATAIVLFTMLLDQLLFALLIPVLLVGMAYVEVVPSSLGPVGTGAFVALFLGMMVWVSLFGYAVLYRPEILQKIAVSITKVKWLRRYRRRVTREMFQLRENARLLRTQPPRFFLKGMLLTAANWFARFSLPLVIVWSIYPTVDDLLFFLRTIAITVGMIVLPTPGGSGGIEGLYALFLGPLMPRAAVAPTLLAWRILGFYIFIGVGAYLTMYHVQKTIQRKRTDLSNGGEANHEAADEGNTNYPAEEPFQT